MKFGAEFGEHSTKSTITHGIIHCALSLSPLIEDYRKRKQKKDGVGYVSNGEQNTWAQRTVFVWCMTQPSSTLRALRRWRHHKRCEKFRQPSCFLAPATLSKKETIREFPRNWRPFLHLLVVLFDKIQKWTWSGNGDKCSAFSSPTTSPEQSRFIKGNSVELQSSSMYICTAA